MKYILVPLVLFGAGVSLAEEVPSSLAIQCYKGGINEFLMLVPETENPPATYYSWGKLPGIAISIIKWCDHTIGFNSRDSFTDSFIDELLYIHEQNKIDYPNGNPYLVKDKYQLKFSN